MLRFYVKRSKEEGYIKVENPPVNNVWISGENVTEEDLSLLSHRYHMDINTLKDVLDKNELPRVDIKKDSLYVFIRTAKRNIHNNKIITTPLLLVVSDNVFANISPTKTADYKLIAPNVSSDNSIDTLGVLLAAFAAVVAEYEELMKKTASYIQDTSSRLRTREVTNKDFIEFITIEESLNECKMNLNGMLVVAQRLRDSMKGNDDLELSEDIILYIHQLLVAIERHSQSVDGIRNAYSIIANNVLNQRMKTLTSLTLLIALPNLFYGMYGMNIRLPFQQEIWAYAGVVGFTIAIAVAVYLIGRKKGIF